MSNQNKHTLKIEVFLLSKMKKTIPLFQKRGSGILLHPASLPGQWGIGTFGQEAYDFIDKLSAAGVSYWQMLPLSPTGFGNSPYQSWSSFAGNQLFISPLLLQDDGLLPPETTHERCDSEKIDYEFALNASEFFLRRAFEEYCNTQILSEEFNIFCRKEKFWLLEHALFAAARKHLNAVSLQEWPSDLRKHKQKKIEDFRSQFKKEIDFQKFVQFLFYRQWFSLKKYANERGIQIIGDIPIYVAADSVEVWNHPELFEVNSNLKPLLVAGVPPDYFSETGQLWGNPLYRWKAHKQSGFQWWHKRLAHSFRLYDVVRIDHFRGFADYWSIPAGAETAETGKWKKAPGIELFESFQTRYGKMPVIAEDLGILSNEAVALRNYFQFPGMKILQFAFLNPAENLFLPHFYDAHCVVYTGTHDNNTLRGWYEEDASPGEIEFISDYIQCREEGINENLIRLAWSSVANTVIVPVQDLFNLNSASRMNMPGTVEGNWMWKMTQEQFEKFPVEQLKKLNRIFSR
jgi:4-alpha-glucanotransferase